MTEGAWVFVIVWSLLVLVIGGPALYQFVDYQLWRLRQRRSRARRIKPRFWESWPRDPRYF